MELVHSGLESETLEWTETKAREVEKVLMPFFETANVQIMSGPYLMRKWYLEGPDAHRLPRLRHFSTITALWIAQMIFR